MKAILEFFFLTTGHLSLLFTSLGNCKRGMIKNFSSERNIYHFLQTILKYLCLILKFSSRRTQSNCMYFREYTVLHHGTKFTYNIKKNIFILFKILTEVNIIFKNTFKMWLFRKDNGLRTRNKLILIKN